MPKFYRIQRASDYLGPYCFDLEVTYSTEESQEIYSILHLEDLMGGFNHPAPRSDYPLARNLESKKLSPGQIVYGFSSIEQYREWFDVDTSRYHEADYFLFEYDVPEEEFLLGVTQCGVPTIFFQNFKHTWSRKMLADTLKEVD